MQPRCSRGAAEVQPRCSRGAAKVQPKCSRGAAEVLPRCSRGAAEVQPRCTAPPATPLSLCAARRGRAAAGAALADALQRLAPPRERRAVVVRQSARREPHRGGRAFSLRSKQTRERLRRERLILARDRALEEVDRRAFVETVDERVHVIDRHRAHAPGERVHGVADRSRGRRGQGDERRDAAAPAVLLRRPRRRREHHVAEILVPHERSAEGIVRRRRYRRGRRGIARHGQRARAPIRRLRGRGLVMVRRSYVAAVKFLTGESQTRAQDRSRVLAVLVLARALREPSLRERLLLRGEIALEQVVENLPEEVRRPLRVQELRGRERLAHDGRARGERSRSIARDASVRACIVAWYPRGFCCARPSPSVGNGRASAGISFSRDSRQPTKLRIHRESQPLSRLRGLKNT